MEGTKIHYTLSYNYDVTRPVNPPAMEISQFTQPITAQFISASEINKEGNFVLMNCVYELDYAQITAGKYTVNIQWIFNTYNLEFNSTSNINVVEKTNE